MFHKRTSDIGVATVARLAGAHRLVRDDLAKCSCPARTWARIATLLLEASKVCRAISIDETLWSTVGRCSNKAILTGAGSHSLLGSTVGERATWGWRAGVLFFNERLNGGLGYRKNTSNDELVLITINSKYNSRN